jgi:pyruvate,water dikinase
VDNFYWLHQIQDSDHEIVGDRGLDLSRLIHQDHPVIPGFVIPAPSFWAFLDTIDWREPFFVDLSDSNSRLHLEGSDPQHLQYIAQGIRDHILSAAVSSEWLSQFSEILQQWSAPAVTFQGYLSGSDLNTEGIIDPVGTAGTPTAMADGFKQAIAEFFRARSLFYWDYWGVTLQRLQPTLLVQPLYSAVASGMIQLDSDHWQLQVTPGLNLSIDWGETEPDCYQINPRTRQIQSQKQGHKLIAYRLKSTVREHLSEADQGTTPQTIPLTADWTASPVVGEILPEDQQTPWVLNANQLETLIQLTQNAQDELDQPCQLRWILAATTPHGAEEFYWYSVEGLAASTQSAAVTDSRLSEGADYSPSPKHPLLSGLGVSGGRAIAKAVVLPGTSVAEAQFQAGSILVISEITTESFPLLKQAVGVVAERGGMTGHGAILARELGIPAVFGIHYATQQIQTGEFLLIEGDQGEVHLLGMEQPVEPLLPIPSVSPVNASPTPAITIATHLMVNISQPQSINRLHNLPIDGVGLLRSELLALDILPLQTENGRWDFQQWLQPQIRSGFIQPMAESLRLFAEALAPKPIFYRALDLREFYPEARPFWGETHWEYIALQQRLHRPSSRTDADSVTLFDLELSVLSQLHRWGYNNIHLILPLVRSVEEFSVYQYWVKQAGLTDNQNFQLWMMAEVPSVLFLLPDYVKAGVEGIAIGTNDLTQFMLGINRNNNEHLTHLNASHPAVMAAIKEMIQMAKAAGIPCSICGDAPILYPNLIPDFIQWGVNALSVHPEAIASTYEAIVQAEKLITLNYNRGNRE